MGLFYTIGYEAAALEDVLATLKSSGVTMLVDVREIAGSRRKGFSKTALSEALADEDIAYLHLRALGDPKPGREAARKGYMAEFRRIYSRHLETASAQEALIRLATIATEEIVCLLCYEAEARDCHRSIVASSLTKATRLSVEHLKPHEHARAAQPGTPSDHHQGSPTSLH